MSNKPIIFNGEMVRAILAGRKTQTRRVIKPQPLNVIFENGDWIQAPCDLDPKEHIIKCPYAQPGDKLWVRETWTYLADGFAVSPMIGYRADMETKVIDTIPDGETVYNVEKPDVWKWRPSIHMPRWASRITLEVTDVWVERVRDISPTDALSEGMHIDWSVENAPENQFKRLWDSIYDAKGFGWDKNPWCWVIEFKLEEGE